MHYDNGFELLIAVVFQMIPQLVGLGPKYQDLLIPFLLGEGEPLPYFHLRALLIRSKLVLMRDQKVQISNLILKYIMEMSKLKHLHRYMDSFEIYFKRFERQLQSNQLSIIFNTSIELIFETLETADIDMNLSHSIIEPIVNKNFLNTFHHQNGPNQLQHTNKNYIQKYQHITTRQQYQHINTVQQNQHRNPSQKYHSRSFQRHRTSSIPYPK